MLHYTWLMSKASYTSSSGSTNGGSIIKGQLSFGRKITVESTPNIKKSESSPGKHEMILNIVRFQQNTLCYFSLLSGVGGFLARIAQVFSANQRGRNLVSYLKWKLRFSHNHMIPAAGALGKAPKSETHSCVPHLQHGNTDVYLNSSVTLWGWAEERNSYYGS